MTLPRRPALAEAAAVAAIIAAQVYLLTRTLHAGTSFDEGVYLLSVDTLGQGEALGRQVFTSQGPLFYVLLRAIGLVFGVSTTGLRLGIVVVAAIGTLLAFLLGRRVAGTSGGLACALALVMAPKLSYLGGSIYADMPAMVVAVGALYLASRRAAFGAGAAIAAATLVKVSALTALPTLVVLLALERPRLRPLLAAAGGAAATVAAVAIVFVHDLRGIWTGAVTYHLRGRTQIGLNGRHEVVDFFSTHTPFTWFVVAGVAATAISWRRVWPFWLWAIGVVWFELKYTPLRENQLVSLPYAFAVPAGIALGAAAMRLPARFLVPAGAAVALAAAGGWAQQLRVVTNDHAEPESPLLVHAAAELRRVTKPGALVISDQPIVAFLAHRHTLGQYVDTASLRFDTRTLSDAKVQRDAKRVSAVVVGRAFGTHARLLRFFRSWFRRRLVLQGATIYYDPPLGSSR